MRASCYVRGTSVMDGYWEQAGEDGRGARGRISSAGETRATYWHTRTGDLVRLRPDGDYEFLGRRSTIRSRVAGIASSWVTSRRR